MVSLLHMVTLKSPSSHSCSGTSALPSFSFSGCVWDKSVKRPRRLKAYTSVGWFPSDSAFKWCHANKNLQTERKKKQISEGRQRKRQMDERLPGKSVASRRPNVLSTWHHAPFLIICCSLSMRQSGGGWEVENGTKTQPRPHLETIRRVMSSFDRREY